MAKDAAGPAIIGLTILSFRATIIVDEPTKEQDRFF